MRPPEGPLTLNCDIPDRKGYYIILSVWTIADTGNAFYQVIDANITGSGTGPVDPPNPLAIEVTPGQAITADQITAAFQKSNNVTITMWNELWTTPVLLPAATAGNKSKSVTIINHATGSRRTSLHLNDTNILIGIKVAGERDSETVTSDGTTWSGAITVPLEKPVEIVNGAEVSGNDIEYIFRSAHTATISLRDGSWSPTINIPHLESGYLSKTVVINNEAQNPTTVHVNGATVVIKKNEKMYFTFNGDKWLRFSF